MARRSTAGRLPVKEVIGVRISSCQHDHRPECPRGAAGKRAVNNGPNTASSLASEAGIGSVASGTIGGNPVSERFSSRQRQAAPAARLRPAPAIMDSVPETPDQQTRTAVTRRIIAHVRRGWPRLDEPIVRHRGRFCYVSALLPGYREPAPICGCATRDRPIAGPSGSTWPAATATPSPNCRLPSAQDRHSRRRGQRFGCSG